MTIIEDDNNQSSHHNNTSVDKPKKTKKPIRSVAFVIKIAAEVAGSLPNRFMMRGTMAPKKPAAIKLNIIEMAATTPSKGF